MRSARWRDPAARTRAPEGELAWSGALVSVVVAVPVVGLAAVLSGWRGLLGALLATALVTGMFALSGVILACARRLVPGNLAVASLAGVAIRFIVYALVLLSLRDVEVIHRTTTALATAVLLIATLAYEVRYVSTRPGFFWLQTKERTKG